MVPLHNGAFATPTCSLLGCIRVEFKTDALNTRSRQALVRIGATEEGTFRNHMIMPEDGFATASISASSTTNGPVSRRISKGSWLRTRPHPLGFPPRPPGEGKDESPRGSAKNLLCYPVLVERG
jgi:hypothetical protein